MKTASSQGQQNEAVERRPLMRALRIAGATAMIVGTTFIVAPARAQPTDAASEVDSGLAPTPTITLNVVSAPSTPPPAAATTPAAPKSITCEEKTDWPVHASRARCYSDHGKAVPWHVYLLWMTDGLVALINSIILAVLLLNVRDITGGEDGDAYLRRALQAVLFFPMLLLTGAHLYGITSFVLGFSYLADFARPALVSVGVLAVGFLFGALFGLPRRRRPTVPVEGGKSPELYADFGDRLDDVADWLTKLLLGAGLTQLHEVWDNGPAINQFFARAAGMNNDSPLGTVLGIGALAGGFLLGYICTLLFLPVALQAGFKQLVGLARGVPKLPTPDMSPPDGGSAPAEGDVAGQAAADTAQSHEERDQQEAGGEIAVGAENDATPPTNTPR